MMAGRNGRKSGWMAGSPDGWPELRMVGQNSGSMARTLWMDGRISGWMAGTPDGWPELRMVGRISGWMAGNPDGWPELMDGRNSGIRDG